VALKNWTLTNIYSVCKSNATTIPKSLLQLTTSYVTYCKDLNSLIVHTQELLQSQIRQTSLAVPSLLAVIHTWELKRTFCYLLSRFKHNMPVQSIYDMTFYFSRLTLPYGTREPNQKFIKLCWQFDKKCNSMSLKSFRLNRLILYEQQQNNHSNHICTKQLHIFCFRTKTTVLTSSIMLVLSNIWSREQGKAEKKMDRRCQVQHGILVA